MLAAGGRPHSLWPSQCSHAMVASFLWSEYDRTSESIHHHFSHVLVVTQTSLGLMCSPDFRGYIRGLEVRIIGATLEVGCHDL